jgi:hypothetical protein
MKRDRSSPFPCFARDTTAKTQNTCTFLRLKKTGNLLVAYDHECWNRNLADLSIPSLPCAVTDMQHSKYGIPVTKQRLIDKVQEVHAFGRRIKGRRRPKTICGECHTLLLIVSVHVSCLTIEISSKNLHEQGFCLLFGGYFTHPGPTAP